MEQIVLAQRGHGGYRQYRIPAMAVMPSGRIITIYDARFDFDDLPAPVDLVIRTSDDNGNTWSDQNIFR
jgi:sialidase-1